MTRGNVRQMVCEQTASDIESLSARLEEHYLKEAELYRSVLKLTELQHTNLGQSDDIRDFITLLHRKEDLIRAIDKIELAVEEEKATWLEISEDEKQACNKALNAVLDSIIALIEQIMHVERENEEFLRVKKDEVEQQLATIRKSCRATKGFDTKPDPKVISTIS